MTPTRTRQQRSPNPQPPTSSDRRTLILKGEFCGLSPASLTTPPNTFSHVFLRPHALLVTLFYTNESFGGSRDGASVPRFSKRFHLWASSGAT